METNDGQPTDAELDDIFNEGTKPEIEAEESSAEVEASSSEETQPDLEAQSEDSAENVQETITQKETDEVENLRREYKELEHKYKSDDGRIAALQRQVSDLQKVNDTLSSQPKEETPKVEVPSYDSKQIVQDLYSGDEAKAQAAVEAISNMKSSGGDGEDIDAAIRKAVQPLMEAEKARYDLSQEEVLESVHPDWRTTVGTEEFAEWLNSKPVQIQQLSRSDEASDAVELLNYYALSSAKPEAPTSSAKTQVEELQEKRSKQLESGKPLASKSGAGAQGGMPSDPDAVFDYLERNDPDLNRAYGR